MQLKDNPIHTISIGELPLPLGFSHIVISGHDETGRQMWEMNGLATNANNERIPIGMPHDSTDTIKGYFDTPTYFGNQVRNQVVIVRGTADEISEYRDYGIQTIRDINRLDLDYRIHNQNSNSLAGTILQSFGITPQQLLNSSKHSFEGKVPGFTEILIHDLEHCFLAGTPISMWDGTAKPIEHVRPGDVVTSYDEDGNLVPGRVSKTKENRVKHVLDVFGLMVTPGHVTFCGEGKFEGRHVPIIDILRSDGALVLKDGSMKRAATNFGVGSIEDRFVHAIVTEDVPGTDNVRIVESGKVRLGTRYMHPTGADITVLDIIRRTGGTATEDGYVLLSDGVTKTPFVWTFTNRLPKPEDFVLQRSQVTLTDIYEADEWEAVVPQVPPPFLGETGPSFGSTDEGYKAPGSNSGRVEDNRSPNIPLSMLGTADQPTMSRKQRRAYEARQRKQAKHMTRTVH